LVKVSHLERFPGFPGSWEALFGEWDGAAELLVESAAGEEVEAAVTGRAFGWRAARWVDANGVRVGAVVALEPLLETDPGSGEGSDTGSVTSEVFERMAEPLGRDLNNLLSIVHGGAEILIQNLSLDGATRGVVKGILGSAERGMEIAGRLSEVGHNRRLAPVPIDLAEALEAAVRSAKERAPAGVSVLFDGREGDWRTTANTAQLAKAVREIIENAFEAMPRGGLVTVALEGCSGDVLTFSITDTGSGMTPEVLASATDPYFTTRSGNYARGLGLALAYGFFRNSGGSLSITSSPGCGTRATASLPYVPWQWDMR
jgi:signal transduction histidine kinase